MLKKIISYALLTLVVLFAAWWLFTDQRSIQQRHADYCGYLLENDRMIREANAMWGSQRGSKGEDYLERSQWLVEKDGELRAYYEVSEDIQEEAYARGWDDVCYEEELTLDMVEIKVPLFDPQESILTLE